MSEQQLERSVLEAKEREELLAIATAIGTGPTARARKSDLVKQILRATGVEEGDDSPEPEERPRARTRARKAVAPAPDTLPLGDDGGSGAPAANGADGNSTAAEVPAGAGTPGDGAPAPSGAPAGAAPGERPSGDRPSGDRPPGDRPPGDRASGDRVSGEGGGARREPPAQAAPAQGAPPQPPSVQSGGRATEPAPQGGDGGSEPAPRFEETGNRRSRRRRGRDRAERAERELPGQVVDQPFAGEPAAVDGFLDLREEGYGFLRAEGHLPGPDDVYVSISQVRRFGLRRGDRLEGASRPAGGNEKYPALLRVDTVSGRPADEARDRPRFDALTPAFPDRRLRLGPPDAASVTSRVVDLVTPIGAGARVLVAAPPRSGRRTLVRELAHGIEVAEPDVEVIVVAIDERPEEIAELRRVVRSEVVATSFDRPADEHVQVAELTIERAKRRVELGADVVVLFDGLTRLGRAYNLAQPASGRVLAGGIDTGSLNPPKRLFGAARNIEEAGSLTIIATALVETGSRMDDVIFDELRDTANVEIRLDQAAAGRRLFPAVDLDASATTHEDAVVGEGGVEALRRLRASLADGTGALGVAALERLVDRVRATTTNEELVAGA